MFCMCKHHGKSIVIVLNTYFSTRNKYMRKIYKHEYYDYSEKYIQVLPEIKIYDATDACCKYKRRQKYGIAQKLSLAIW